MNTLSIEDFYSYVRTQPVDKAINNTSWSTCAVGQYLEARGYPLTTVSRGEPQYMCFKMHKPAVTKFQQELEDISWDDDDFADYSDDECTLFNKLSCGMYDTYGELSYELLQVTT